MDIVGVYFSNFYLLFNTLYYKKKILVEKATQKNTCDHYNPTHFTEKYWKSIKYCPFCLKSTTEKITIPDKYKKIYKLQPFVSDNNNFDKIIENYNTNTKINIYTQLLKKIINQGSIIWFYDERYEKIHSLNLVSKQNPIINPKIIDTSKIPNEQLEYYLSLPLILNSGSKDFNELICDSTIHTIINYVLMQARCNEITPDLEEMQKYHLIKYIFSEDSGFNLQNHKIKKYHIN